MFHLFLNKNAPYVPDPCIPRCLTNNFENVKPLVAINCGDRKIRGCPRVTKALARLTKMGY